MTSNALPYLLGFTAPLVAYKLTHATTSLNDETIKQSVVGVSVGIGLMLFLWSHIDRRK